MNLTSAHPIADAYRHTTAVLVTLTCLATLPALALSMRPTPVPLPEGASLATRTRLDINTAPAAELQLLPGIGPNYALAIIDRRQTTGPFETVNDLTDVTGIGQTTLDKVRDFVAVEP